MATPLVQIALALPDRLQGHEQTHRPFKVIAVLGAPQGRPQVILLRSQSARPARLIVRLLLRLTDKPEVVVRVGLVNGLPLAARDQALHGILTNRLEHDIARLIVYPI